MPVTDYLHLVFVAEFFWPVGEKWHLILGYSTGWSELSLVEAKNNLSQACVGWVRPTDARQCPPAVTWPSQGPYADTRSRRCLAACYSYVRFPLSRCVSRTRCISIEEHESLPRGPLCCGGKGCYHNPEAKGTGLYRALLWSFPPGYY